MSLFAYYFKLYKLHVKKQRCLMKKIYSLVAAVLYASCFSQEVMLTHNFFSKEENPEKIFESPSPYKALQEVLFKNKICISCLQKENSFLFKKENPMNALQEKIFNFLSSSEKFVAFSDNPKTQLVFWNLPPELSLKKLKKIPSDRLVLFAYEPPVISTREYEPKVAECFSKIYTWNDELVDDKKYFKFFYPVLKPMANSLPGFSERKLCAMIAGNKSSHHPYELYSERQRILAQMEQKNIEGFDLYGPDWDTSAHTSYRGYTDDKMETLKNYRFSICYENMTHIKGYITEKIFDCFAAGTIPVYLGASNITDYIPKHCFIDRRDFNSDAELIKYLQQIDESTYCSYVNHIRAYLKSREAHVFSIENFCQTFKDAVKE